MYFDAGDAKGKRVAITLNKFSDLPVCIEEHGNIQVISGMRITETWYVDAKGIRKKGKIIILEV